LKPSFIGGFLEAPKEWIHEKKGLMDGGLRPALESNVGLNAQLSGLYNNLMPQGPGTGALIPI
jgi:hypothetical protein